MAPKPRTLLLTLGGLVLCPGLSTSLVLAQSGADLASDPGAAPGSEPRVQPGPPPPVPVQVPPGIVEQRAQSPHRFDASLDDLVREGVVSPAERMRVHRGLFGPINAQQREACSSGALSQLECNGVIVRGRGRGDATTLFGGADVAAGGNGSSGFRTDASPLPPISVPVSALLAGAGGSFRLTDVFGRTPRPAPIAGNGNMGPIFPLIGSAITTSGFGWPPSAAGW